MFWLFSVSIQNQTNWLSSLKCMRLKYVQCGPSMMSWLNHTFFLFWSIHTFFIAVKGYWSTKTKKGYGPTKTSLTVHTVWAAELSLGSTKSSQMCVRNEDELFQSEVSSGSAIASQICLAQICKANLWLRLTSKLKCLVNNFSC